MSATSPRFDRIRPVLDLVATALVIVTAVAVLALTAATWNERQTNGRLSEDPSLGPAQFPLQPPDLPQVISGSPTAGSPGASLAVIEYGDFQCQYCAQFAKDVWPLVKSKYVDTGMVRFAFKHLPLAPDGRSRTAALAAECAHRQGRFMEMRDLLFMGGPAVWTANSLETAHRLSLNHLAFTECLAGSEAAASIDRDISSAMAIGVVATPWFLVGRLTDGEMVTAERVLIGMTSFDEFEAVFDELNTTGVAD